AIERADVPMVKVLLAHGAHPKNCYIVKADDTQNKELIKILLAAGAEPHTFIFQAADNGNTTLLRLSLEALTDGISQDKDAKTARCIELSLARAKEKGHTDLVRILSEYQRQMSLQD
ncbi:MAG TPA: hypothetical protein VHV83_14775, partial [Armatimonadota bacterium]|nr:hypothetical protein [Armatimonadota bacterium]